VGAVLVRDHEVLPVAIDLSPRFTLSLRGYDKDEPRLRR
jgi:hypothetical protein